MAHEWIKWLSRGATGELLRKLDRINLQRRSNPYYRGPKSDHFDGRVFFNPEGKEPNGTLDLLHWLIGREKAEWPAEWPSPHHGTRPAQRIGASDLKVTLIGHATVLIQSESLNLLTDPIYTDRPSPIRFAGPKRTNPPGVAFADLPPIDAVLLTHNHYDHLDLDTIQQLVKRDNPKILAPLGNDTIINKTIAEANVLTGDWGDIIGLNDRVKIHFEPVHHWSARGLRDRRMALWAAFVIETPHLRLYHVGDTGFHEGINFRAAKEKHGGFDLAILPIGAYEPRWFMERQHMSPEEAVKAAVLAGARNSVGHHWGTFQLTDEPIGEPREKLNAALAEADIEQERFLALRPGQVWRVGR